MTTFTNVMLLDERTEVYGNESLMIQKLGRLVLVADSTLGSGVSVHVMNTTDAPVDAYQAQRLRDECLMKLKTFKASFGMTDRCMSKEPDVTIQKAMDGSLTIKLKRPLIDLDTPGGEVYSAIEEEIADIAEEMRDNQDKNGFNSWCLRAVTFMELVKLRTPPVKVLLHLNAPQKDLTAFSSAGFDVIIDISKAGFMATSVPHFWDIYYDSSVAGVEYNPVLLRLPKRLLRPIKIK